MTSIKSSLAGTTSLASAVSIIWFTPSIEQRVPTWLWGKARQPERQYQWSVRAAHLSTDGQGGELIIPLSPDSEIRTFYWN